MDLRQEIVIGDKIDSDFEQLNFAVGFDHNWVTDDYTGEVRKIATVKAKIIEMGAEITDNKDGTSTYRLV